MVLASLAPLNTDAALDTLSETRMSQGIVPCSRTTSLQLNARTDGCFLFRAFPPPHTCTRPSSLRTSQGQSPGNRRMSNGSMFPTY